MSNSPAELKTYSSPKLTKLTPEQAKLLLLGQAGQGGQGAKDLLEVLFSDPNPQGRVSPPPAGESPGGFVTKTPSMASRLWTRAHHGFRRFVRG